MQIRKHSIQCLFWIFSLDRTMRTHSSSFRNGTNPSARLRIPIEFNPIYCTVIVDCFRMHFIRDQCRTRRVWNRNAYQLRPMIGFALIALCLRFEKHYIVNYTRWSIISSIPKIPRNPSTFLEFEFLEWQYRHCPSALTLHTWIIGKLSAKLYNTYRIFSIFEKPRYTHTSGWLICLFLAVGFGRFILFKCPPDIMAKYALRPFCTRAGIFE